MMLLATELFAGQLCSINEKGTGDARRDFASAPRATKRQASFGRALPDQLPNSPWCIDPHHGRSPIRRRHSTGDGAPRHRQPRTLRAASEVLHMADHHSPEHPQEQA